MQERPQPSPLLYRERREGEALPEHLVLRPSKAIEVINLFLYAGVGAAGLVTIVVIDERIDGGVLAALAACWFR